MSWVLAGAAVVVLFVGALILLRVLIGVVGKFGDRSLSKG